MGTALPFYDDSSIDCLALDSTLMHNTASCMVSAGFCDLTNGDEFFLDRGLHTNGFPARFPKEYTKRPLSGNIEFLNVDYFRDLHWFRDLLADAQLMCFEDGARSSRNLYELGYSFTEGLVMRFRTNL